MRRLHLLLLGIAMTGLTTAPALAQAPDTDGDGILDDVECPSGTRPDSDGDGVADCDDPDDDGDGVSTIDEQTNDTDGDGRPDYLDWDDDGDGIPTADERAGGFDGDGDGILDWLDADHENGPLGDPDHDGLSNADEDCLGSDPNDADSDGDTVFDGEEAQVPPCVAPDTDGDGLADIFDPDDDGDGIPTSIEHDAGAYGDIDPRNPGGASGADDVDGDGIPNHLDTDSDGDGKSDHEEAFGSGEGDRPELTLEQIPFVRYPPLKISDVTMLVFTGRAFPDNDGDGIPDWLDSHDEDGPDGDADGDGVPNWREERLGSDPYDDDSDGDGIVDGDEHGDSDGDGILDRLDPDDDGDGILTRDEGTYDVDGDGIPNHFDLDSDGDGRPDSEDLTAKGPCLEGPGSAELPDGDNVALGYCTDRDCDGIPDNQESSQQLYKGGVGVFGIDPDDGEWKIIWTFGPITYQPALCDGPCGLKDYDCDLVPNCYDADWTDGPGENGTGAGDWCLFNW